MVWLVLGGWNYMVESILLINYHAGKTTELAAHQQLYGISVMSEQLSDLSHVCYMYNGPITQPQGIWL